MKLILSLSNTQFGRDLSYHFPTCDLLVVCAGPEVYRLNLDQGRFLNPLITDSNSGINVSEINPAHQLFGFGTAEGTVEFWDPRSRSRVSILTPVVTTYEGANAADLEITALKYRNDGLSLAVGTSTGHTLLYDLRSSRPWLVKDHQYGYEIRSLSWHDGGRSGEEGGKVIVADKKIIKIWDRNHVGFGPSGVYARQHRFVAFFALSSKSLYHYNLLHRAIISPRSNLPRTSTTSVLLNPQASCSSPTRASRLALTTSHNSGLHLDGARSSTT